MKGISIIILFLMIGMRSFAADMASQEISQFFDDLVLALNSKQSEVIANSFSVQGELISLAGGIYKGSKEIQSFFDEGFAGPYKNAKFENYIQFVRFIDSSHAVVDGVWKVIGANIPNYPSCGIFLFNLSKQNGQWKADMFYSSVPREGHTSEHGRTVSWTKICKE